MKGVRFLVVRGAGSTRTTTVAYSDERGPTAPGEWYSWLLIGANNRELGRGAVPFANEASCRLAVQTLPTTVLRPFMGSTGGMLVWSWRVEGTDGPIACGARTYRRRRECVYAVNTFAGAAAVAQAPSGAIRSVKVSWATWRGRDLAAEPGTEPATSDQAPSALARVVTPGESP